MRRDAQALAETCIARYFLSVPAFFIRPHFH